MAVTDIPSRTLDLKTLETNDVVLITLEDGPKVVGRLILIPESEAINRQLQLGVYDESAGVYDETAITWMAGPVLFKLTSEPKDGKWHTVVAAEPIITGQPLTGRLFLRPQRTAIIGTVADFGQFPPQ